mgnify:CR=1 FL=1
MSNRKPTLVEKTDKIESKGTTWYLHTLVVYKTRTIKILLL